jgi:HEPN domain-containing protein
LTIFICRLDAQTLIPAAPPFEHYGKLQSEEAITYASEIIEFARAAMAER